MNLDQLVTPGSQQVAKSCMAKCCSWWQPGESLAVFSTHADH